MPKEQIRKRGKRKPKTDDSGAVDAPADPGAAAHSGTPYERPAGANSAEDQAAAGGIHPSRLAFLRTGVRPAPEPKPEGAEDAGQEEDGAADWTRGDRTESEFPFGVLDPDVKAYFRNVEEQVKDWEGVGSVGEEREDRQLFLASVLSELRGHELQVATDPETSVVLERLLPSLNDWGRRVIGDAVGESWETLVRHRFGSHVAQTWLTLAAGTMDREARGVYPPQHKEQESKTDADGILPTAAEEVTAFVNCILPNLPQLLASPHAAPPIRLLLLVLTPNRDLPSLDAAGGDDGDAAGLVRSKRSGKFRKGQGVQGKSILGDDDEDEKTGKSSKKGKKADAGRQVPEAVAALRGKIRKELMQRLSGVEWQSMGADKVGSASVQLFLQAEREDGDAEADGSLLDTVTQGLVTALNADADGKLPEPQAYLSSMLVSPTGTRLFEAVLKFTSQRVFDAVWAVYMTGKMGKLASHPFANFVVAAGIARLDAAGVIAVAKEVQSVSGGRGLIKTARTGVLLALAERAALLPDNRAAQVAVVSLVQSAVDVGDKPDLLVPALMALKTVPFYEAVVAGTDMPVDDDDERPAALVDASAEAKAAALASRAAWENRRNARPRGANEPNMQGSLLLQALVGLGAGGPLAAAAAPVFESLYTQPTATMVTYACSPIASHVLDKVLTTPAVPPKYRRKLYMSLVGSYDKLAMDKLGSRVADTVWATADGFMKEKIARSLIPHATTLGGDRYGRFLARKLDLHLLQRRPDEWRELHLRLKHHFAHQKEPVRAAPVVPVVEDEAVVPEDETEEEKAAREKRERKEARRKRKAEKEKDEIDVLFEGKEKKEKKSKKSKRE